VRAIKPAIGIIVVVGTIAAGFLCREIIRLRDKLDQANVKLSMLSPRDLGNSRLDVREFAIRSQLAQVPSPIVFVGDSITELAILPTAICGHPTVNAGIAGADVGFYAQEAPTVFEKAEIYGAVIALGTNDSVAGRGDFSAAYRRLIDYFAGRGTKVILANVPPFDPANRYFDLKQWDHNNDDIHRIAVERHFHIIDFSKVSGTMDDGIHLSRAGYELWRAAITQIDCN
jgi:hypothetical protein